MPTLPAYASDHDNMTKGVNFMFYGIGLITGLIIGYFLKVLVIKFREGIHFSVFGYQLSLNKKENIEVLEPLKKKYKRIHL